MQLLHRYFCVDLSGRDVRMAEYPTDAFDGHPLVDGQHCKTYGNAFAENDGLESIRLRNTMCSTRSNNRSGLII